MKYKNLDKVILTDADGVLVDWEWAFDVWMQEHGFEPVPGSKLNYEMAVRYGIPKEQVRKLIRLFKRNFKLPHKITNYYTRRPAYT